MILGQLFTFLALDFPNCRMREIPPYLTQTRSYENNQQSPIHKYVLARNWSEFVELPLKLWCEQKHQLTLLTNRKLGSLRSYMWK